MRRDRKTIWLLTAVLILAVMPAVGATEEPDAPAAAERLHWRLAETARSRTSGDIEVQVHSWPDGVDDAVAAFKEAGGTVTTMMGGTFYGIIGVSSLNTLDADDRVRWVGPPTLVFPEATTGEGIAFIGADDWHAVGWDGAGIKIGIMDSGFTGLAASQAGGDLPSDARMNTQAFGCIDMDGSSQHGTAVAEIVHEIAPQATLYLACVTHTGTMSDALDDWFQPNGVTVVNVSLGTFNTGRGDGTGTVSYLADDARNHGILWVNSAGNYGEKHWSGTLVDTFEAWKNYHDFDGDDKLTFTLANGAYASVFLKWDDWGTWNGSTYTGSDCDLDLELYSGGSLRTSSMNPQDGNDDPVEDIYYPDYQNTTGSPEVLDIKVKITNCSESPRLDVFVLELDNGTLSEPVRAGSISGLVPNDKVTSVGAVCVANVSGTGIEAYSSRGPTIDGTMKPALSAPDAVSGSVYGDNTYGPGCPAGTGVKAITYPEAGLGFTGTSAAAPHAAGAAALIAQALGLTTQDTANVVALHAQLLAHTVDDADNDGTDNAYGEGILDLGTPPTPKCNGLDPTVTMTPGVPYVDNTGVDDVVIGTSGNDSIETKSGNDTVCGLGGDDTIKTGKGIDWVDAGAGDDVVRAGARDDTVYGRAGEDVVNGGGGVDYIDGGDDDDVIWDSFGADVDLYGGAGDDKFVAGRVDANTYIGDDGNDRVDYRAMTAGIDVSLAAGTGTRTVVDTYVSIEQIRGSKYADVIIGDGGTNVLIGYSGDDEIYGRGGDDNLVGDNGDDLLNGGSGTNDRLIGGPGGADRCINGGYIDSTCELLV